MKTKRKKNHYVPVWYQSRFLPEGQSSLCYLDLWPFKDLDDGRRVKLRKLYNWGPKKCFYEKDLYTTKIFGIRNEEIEEFLFGKIDEVGHKAINALVNQDFRSLSDLFSQVFVYMDAQKLRTPKGLDWIRSNYFQLSRLELLLEMQFLRTMHCTMWVEGVMEIVSAKDSDIKFIISDHPVTVYNPACDLDSKICKYPNDPPTAWKASQTIFTLDIDHCFILTNLEYAREPHKVDPLISRTNPRYFAETITRWDATLRDRELKPEEVCAINYIIKKRARKYIAAAQSDWLYPENNLPDNDWKSLHKVVLPPKHKIHMLGGEIYVGGKDGKLPWYQDAFGRRNTSHENENDPVRKSSIKKRNRILYNAVLEIFGFSKGKDWDDFRKELTDDKIKELYRVVGGLWNPDTEIMNLIPKPNDNYLSAFYSGSIDARVIPITVLGYSSYVDRIILISPFMNPRSMNEKYSPYHSPSKYKYDTIKNVFFLLELMPLIDAGIVEMIPDPCDFDLDFKKRIYKMAELRARGLKLTKEDIGYTEKLMRDDLSRSMLNLPPEILKQQIKESIPDISEEDLKKTLEYAQKVKLVDPLSPIEPSASGEENAQYHISKMGGNIEIALYLAQATGSYLYTDVKFRWKEFQSSILKKPGEENSDLWAPIVHALERNPLVLYIDHDPKFYLQIKENESLKELIDLLRDIRNSVRNIKDSSKAEVKAKELASRLYDINMKNISKEMKKQARKIAKKAKSEDSYYRIKVPVNYMIPNYGLSRNTVTQILLTHGFNTPYWDEVPFASLLDMENLQLI